MSELRLDSLKVENFRSISGSWTIPLDAQVTLVHGPNGAGKTSLLSAIELAATGTVAFLDAQASGPHDVLLNRRYPLGGVELRLRGMDGATRLGSYELGGARPKGRPALDRAEQIHFLERCFLPQTALGRLLEAYTKSSKDVDTALVRFVKSVVGLDELDGVIEGLHAAGHIARTKAISNRWSEAERQASQFASHRRRIESELKHAENEMQLEIQNLRALAGDQVLSSSESELAAQVVSLLRRDETSQNELSTLEAIRVRLAGVSTAFAEGFAEPPEDGQGGRRDLSQTAASLDAWERSYGAQILERLNTIRQSTLGLPPASSTQLFVAFDETRARLDDRVRIANQARRTFAQTEQRKGEVQDQLAQAKDELSRAVTARGTIVVPSDVRSLIEIIQLTLPLVDSEVCPVCDSPFVSEHHQLSEHLSSKLEALSRDARGLIEIENSARNLEQTIRELQNEFDQIPATPEPTDESDLNTAVRDMNSFDASIRDGRDLMAALERFEGRSAELIARKASNDLARRLVSEIREELGLPESRLEINEEIQRLERAIEDRIQVAEYEQTRRARLAASADAVDSIRREVEQLRADLLTIGAEAASRQGRLDEAAKRKDAANDLRKEAERIRSAVINDVFDATLNTLWADLFGRFVPTEPFVPRFKKQTNATRSIDVALETLLPDGETSGEPSSVLSYGNTNTAALSLFLALHLSAPRQLPWLILDDPVQSMDDIHIANFSTIVRQLAFSHGRQIIIAVHQRELFDYLALELSPASSDETLVKISLDRFTDTTTVAVERVEYRPERELLAMSE